MIKKNLSAIVAVGVIIIAGVYFFVFRGGIGIGGIGGGIRDDSMMGAMKNQGQAVISKAEFISECLKETDASEKDTCYGLGAYYYRDASFCKYVKAAEAKTNCTQENIDKMYAAQQEMMKGAGGLLPGGTLPLLPGAGALPGFGVTTPEEETPAETTQPKTTTTTGSTAAVTDKDCIDVMAHAYGYLNLLETNPTAAATIQAKVSAIVEKYMNMTEDMFNDACAAKMESATDFMSKVEARMKELGYE
ncbi:MAG: hypothetical protein PHP03_01825 [Candidatus Pacebacteria bacterium]|nr:hypothetical protein [Candidatus Paceibacterota bacterium]